MKEKSSLVLGVGTGNLETSAKIEKSENKELLLTANHTTRDAVREVEKISKGYPARMRAQPTSTAGPAQTF